MPKELESPIDLQPLGFSMDRRHFVAATGSLVGGTALGLTARGRATLAARVISGHQSFDHLNVGPNEVVVFNPNKDTTVHAHMVHVEGVLRMRPAKPGVKHRLLIGEGLHVEGGGWLDMRGIEKEGMDSGPLESQGGSALDQGEQCGWLENGRPSGYHPDPVTQELLVRRCLRLGQDQAN